MTVLYNTMLPSRVSWIKWPTSWNIPVKSIKSESCLVSDLATSVHLPDCLIILIGLVKASTTNDAVSVLAAQSLSDTLGRRCMLLRLMLQHVCECVFNSDFYVLWLWIQVVLWEDMWAKMWQNKDFLASFSFRAGCCPVGWVTPKSRIITRSA